MADPKDPPYKFLDSYGERDAAIFFGRERETEILLADVVTSRFVVLFARTGTGKTSLINAAVRPELEQRGFATFFVRVLRDPTASAREELGRQLGGSLSQGSLADQLELVAKDQERPIVVFFDQFEEFFLFQAREEPLEAREFIENVARLHRTRASGVHIVLSIREDFYVELDAFRDEIPTIFHNDSNLRLRWFDESQARAAIVGPAETERVEIEPRLVDRLVEDLARRHGLVEPAQLQIVCHTLWGELSNGRIPLERYLALGTEGENATIAEQILNRRLVEQFRAFGTRQEFVVLEQLLAPGVLSTERGTKRPREVADLARELAEHLVELGDVEGLRSILDRLEESHLMRRYLRDDVVHVELTHDYLVTEPERLAELRRSVRNIWPRRVLDEGAAAWDDERQTFSGETDELEEVLARVVFEWERAGREGRPHPDDLVLSPDDGGLLLRLALHRGIHGLPVFELTSSLGLPVWDVVRARLAGEHIEDAVNAISLLAELGSPQAVELLRDAIERPELAKEAITALGRIAGVEAVDVLAAALPNEVHGRDAQDALEPIARAGTDQDARLRATEALVDHLKGQLADPVTAAFALEDLGRLEALPAVAVLERALADDELAEDADGALRRLARSSRAEVAERARSVLAAAKREPRAGRRIEPARQTPLPGKSAKRRSDRDALATHLSIVARRLLEGRVVAVLGAEVAADQRRRQEWVQGRELPSPAELAEYLAQRLPQGADARDLPAVAQAVAMLTGEDELQDRLREVFDASYAPTPVHTFLASVPSLIRAFDASARPLLVVSTAYDDTLERAFAERDEPCDVVFPTGPKGRFAVMRPDGRVEELDGRSGFGEPLLEERPALLMLCGSTRHGSRLVVTEDDFVDFLLSADQAFPTEILARLGRSHLLFLGYGVRGWTSRAAVARPIGSKALSYSSYAVARTFDAVEARLWETRGVEVVEESLGVYVVELERHLQEAGASLSEQEPTVMQDNVASYREAAESYSDHETAVAALLQLAELHHESEDYQAEIEVCNQALERLPDDLNALLQRAGAYWYAEQYDDAIRDFTRVLELQPDSPDAYSGRGQVLAEAGRFEEAIPDLDRAMKTGPKTVAAYARNGKGLALGGLGRFKESLKELDRSLSAEPGNAWAYYNRALTWERMGDKRRAAADFRRALDANDPPLNPGKRTAARARVGVR